MGDKNLFLEFFATYRHELGYSFIAAVVAAARSYQQEDGFRFVITNGLIVAAIAFGMSTILEAFGINGGKWGYLASVLLGYVGHKIFITHLLDRLVVGKGGHKP